MARAGRASGFTIVEMAVVVGIIGILAVVIIVGYGGAVQQSQNGARISAAKDAILTVKNLLSQKRPAEVMAALEYNSVLDWYRACIGRGIADINGDSRGDCGYFNNTPHVSQYAAFNNLMRDNSRLITMSAYPPTKSTDGAVVTAPFLQTVWVDSKSVLAVEFSLQGEGRDCELTPLIYRVPPSYTTRTLTAPAGDAAKYTRSITGVTECVIVVADNIY